MIRRLVPALYLLAISSVSVQSQGLLKQLQEGASKAGEAISDGAADVGAAIGKGADAVGDSYTSTRDLLKNEATPQETRARLDAMAEDILSRLLSENPAAHDLSEQAAGYAVFDARRVSVIPVSGAYGRGVAVSPDGKRTYMNMGSGGVGGAIGIGGFETQFVIFFETEGDFTSFVTNGYDATAETGVMAGEDSTDGNLRFVDGRSVFVLARKGWRVNANLSGTHYWQSPELN